MGLGEEGGSWVVPGSGPGFARRELGGRNSPCSVGRALQPRAVSPGTAVPSVQSSGLRWIFSERRVRPDPN